MHRYVHFFQISLFLNVIFSIFILNGHYSYIILLKCIMRKRCHRIVICRLRRFKYLIAVKVSKRVY